MQQARKPRSSLAGRNEFPDWGQLCRCKQFQLGAVYVEKSSPRDWRVNIACKQALSRGGGRGGACLQAKVSFLCVAKLGLTHGRTEAGLEATKFYLSIWFIARATFFVLRDLAGTISL